jgi:hypothetical protein
MKAASITAVILAGLTFAAAPVRAADVHVDVNIGPPAWVYEAPPHVVVVPGVPHVYYAPELGVNFFTYGGRYYTYDQDRWYVAHGGHGPWTYVERRYVPAPVLRVPTRYYHVPPRLVGGGHWNRGSYGGHGKAKYHHGNDKHWKNDNHRGGGKGHGKKQHR